MKHTLEAFHSNPIGYALSLRGGRPAWSTAVGLGPIPYRFAGSNPAPRISFSHAGENHVHAVNNDENPAPRISFKPHSRPGSEPIQRENQGSELMLSHLQSENTQQLQARLGRPFASLNRDLPTHSIGE